MVVIAWLTPGRSPGRMWGLEELKRETPMSYFDAPGNEYHDSRIMAAWEERWTPGWFPYRLARQMTPAEYLRYRMSEGWEYGE